MITSGSTVEGLRTIDFNETSLVFVNEVTTDNWDASPPTGCPGAYDGSDPGNPVSDAMILGEAATPNTVSTTCYDGMRN